MQQQDIDRRRRIAVETNAALKKQIDDVHKAEMDGFRAEERAIHARRNESELRRALAESLSQFDNDRRRRDRADDDDDEDELAIKKRRRHNDK